MLGKVWAKGVDSPTDGGIDFWLEPVSAIANLWILDNCVAPFLAKVVIGFIRRVLGLDGEIVVVVHKLLCLCLGQVHAFELLRDLFESFLVKLVAVRDFEEFVLLGGAFLRRLGFGLLRRLRLRRLRFRRSLRRLRSRSHCRRILAGG